MLTRCSKNVLSTGRFTSTTELGMKHRVLFLGLAFLTGGATTAAAGDSSAVGMTHLQPAFRDTPSEEPYLTREEMRALAGGTYLIRNSLTESILEVTFGTDGTVKYKVDSYGPSFPGGYVPGKYSGTWEIFDD